jgi:hypothetical protein
MPRGDRSKYTDKQERKADHIAEGDEKKGVSKKEAEGRTRATFDARDDPPRFETFRPPTPGLPAGSPLLNLGAPSGGA